MYYKVKYGDITVNYLPELDGGGMTFGQQYLRVIKEKLGHVGHAFEYCAGPGFIGFSLLANGLCDPLTLADVNPVAIKAVEATTRENHLEDRVKVYQSDCLDSIPQTEKWDLVVSNPPHFDGTEEGYRATIRLVDPGWIIHKRFYRDVRKFLNPGASVIFQENSHATKRDDFVPMIQETGLSLVDTFELNSGSRGLGLSIPVPAKLTELSQKIATRVMLPLEMLLNIKPIEKLVKDNNLYRRLSALPVFVPSHFYFIWSRNQAAQTEKARAS